MELKDVPHFASPSELTVVVNPFYSSTMVPGNIPAKERPISFVAEVRSQREFQRKAEQDLR